MSPHLVSPILGNYKIASEINQQNIGYTYEGIFCMLILQAPQQAVQCSNIGRGYSVHGAIPVFSCKIIVCKEIGAS